MNFLIACLAAAIGVASANVLLPYMPEPQDGSWAEWGMWSRCSSSCGGGTHTRFRDCKPVPESSSGKLDIVTLMLLTGGLEGGGGSSSLSTLLPLLLTGGTSSSSSGMDPLTLLMLFGNLGGNNNNNANSTSSSLFDNSLLPLLLSGGGQGSTGSSIDPTLLLLLGGGFGGSDNNNNTTSSSTIDPLLLMQLLGGNLLGGGSQEKEKCIGLRLQIRQCAGIPCPIVSTPPPTPPPTPPTPPPQNCLSFWGAWQQCSATCGNGVAARFRSCNCKNPFTGFSECQEALHENKPCNNYVCGTDPPATPSWGSWSKYSSCAGVPCLKKRSRNCSVEGACEGAYEQSVECRVCSTTSEKSCSDISDYDRQDCGSPGITKFECESKGCCFDNTKMNIPWCFGKV